MLYLLYIQSNKLAIMIESNIQTVSLDYLGIYDATLHYQLSPEELHNISIAKNQARETVFEALAVETGEFTGRSPNDRYIVKDDLTEDEVWWGDINIPFASEKFDKLYNKVVNYLSEKELFVRDCYACASKDFRLNVRVVNEYPWSNMFAYNMFLRPTEDELQMFNAGWTIINAPSFKAEADEDGTRQHNFSIINFTKKVVLIGGTGYTGEIKKGIFSVLNFLLPMYKQTLPMHCSANVGEDGDTAIFFGLSGTGKTTLSTDANRSLIGDDEHGWAPDNSIFNFEGGCYAKVINLSREKEPEIFGAIRKGAILENVILDEEGNVDFSDSSMTQNTRVSYPIHHIDNIKMPSIGENIKNIFFLTADAFGVLPPLSKLTASQAAYHFVSGYTAKIAGTEAGVKEPKPIFSACFGAPFMPLHPLQYAEMLSEKISKNKVNVWLVNTGWSGGKYGVGQRISLKHTRAMIKAVLDGAFGNYDYDNYHLHSVFGVAQPRSCPNVPDEILNPRSNWESKEEYYNTAFQLAKAFKENFKKYEAYASEEIRRGGPQRFSDN